jgi:hypothetical protein
MRGAITISLFSLVVVVATTSAADAQPRRRLVGPTETVPVLRIRPRSFLDPGTTLYRGSLDRTTSGFAIGSGGINRVPCDAWEASTPVPFTGSMEELVALCPGDLSVQLYQKQVRLLRGRACYVIAGYAPNGRLASGRWCL